ncbi:uncharacterized protein EDB91DRAFT_1084484 [Suillus paluster]|uniref:uncharacterized protein n=1 Tax=Suillus paluster TaxID=48578 RepID=UPI001B886F18|nr:uncharacterized protein EDB91DRAFT_1084484 [Suillus paluster]KAG1733206.1 hypothetical protein EDB91DRAFT_1084484 [Suillus paluster]
MTHEQSDFLKSKVDGFCLSQLQGEVAEYCTNAYQEWFEKWPEIAEHFKDDVGIMLMESQLMNEQMKQLEYKANPEVKAEIVTQMKTNNDHKDKPCISVLRSEAVKSMAARSEEFIHHMEMEAKIECAHRADQVKANLEAIHTPTEALKTQCLEGLGGVVWQLLDAIHKMTGWHRSVYLGGPDPRMNGEVRVFSFHHGKGFSSFNFRDTLPDHHGCIVEPFTAFLKGAFTVNTSHLSTNSSMTPPAGESLVNVTLGSDGPDITAVNASHPSTNSSMTPPVGESLVNETSGSVGPDITALVAPQSFTSILQGLSHDGMLLDGIHHTPSVPLLNPSLLLEHLLSLDPESSDFSQVDLDSFNLPRFPSLSPSPFDLCPVATSVAPSVSAEAPGASHLPATPMDPEPLMSAVTFMDTAPLTSAITSADAVPLMSAVTSTDAAPVISHLESSSDHLASPMHVPLPAAVGTPAQMDIDDIMELLDDIVNQPQCRSTRSHVPSTHLDEANRIGGDVHVSKKGQNSRALGT